MAARLTSDLLELGGALGAGMALEAYAADKPMGETTPFIVDVVAAAAGVLLATQFGGSVADLGSGIAGGSMGHVGGRLWKYIKYSKTPPERLPGLQPGETKNNAATPPPLEPWYPTVRQVGFSSFSSGPVLEI